MRNCTRLDSVRQGIARFDLDVLIHRYKTPAADKLGLRDLQIMFFLEVKGRGTKCTEAQADTLHILSQIMNNRTRNKHGDGRGHRARPDPKLEGCPKIVQSLAAKRSVRLWAMGGHVLTLEHDTPEDSAWMLWDKKQIDLDTLIGILGCDIDPHSLKPIDWRRRYSDFREQRRQHKLFEERGDAAT